MDGLLHGLQTALHRHIQGLGEGALEMGEGEKRPVSAGRQGGGET